MKNGNAVQFFQRISTLLLVLLSTVAVFVLLGLTLMIFRMISLQAELATLRDSALPRLLKISQLSQEASATISIAPAMSARPTRFEFETLLSRIQDKESSQRALTDELGELVQGDDAARVLRKNGELLTNNLHALTDVVNQQIIVRKKLERHVDFFRKLAKDSSKETTQETTQIRQLANENVYRILNMLLDPYSARFPRNRQEVENLMQQLLVAYENLSQIDMDQISGDQNPHSELLSYWATHKDEIQNDKQSELSNEFKIKALVEENALIANRLLSSANREFWDAGAELETQVRRVDNTIRITLSLILIVALIYIVSNFLTWLVLKRRVFMRLDNIRDELKSFAENRNRSGADPRGDEIGAISTSLHHYMDVIDERESQLAEKTNALEQLSNQLAKYLSPQIYDSIFSGRQEVKVASQRKKLTVFFSDIEGFTETADRLESEELSQLLNHYLTEMSRIALNHGATIDKYVGDAILVFFGDPETQGVREDALACVEMAIEMRKRMSELADIWLRTGIERPLRIRMGISTGYCTVGNFGSEDRMDYTIIGSTVNTASRLESQAPPGDILIAYETYAMVNEKINCEKYGEIEVKGIAYPVAAYRVIGPYDERTPRQRIQEEQRKMKLELNVEHMSREEKAQAAIVLRRALDLVAPDGDVADPQSPDQ